MVKVRAHTLLACSALAAAALFAATSSAETLQMDGTENANTSAFEQSGRPTRGMTQANVESTFGAPQKTDEAVGDPPISKWHYEKFVVYFEYDRVIHAVTRR
jgi:outer membrane protein assembly factor BamE (lipoprotein component of BamABCDE complex)